MVDVRDRSRRVERFPPKTERKADRNNWLNERMGRLLWPENTNSHRRSTQRTFRIFRKMERFFRKRRFPRKNPGNRPRRAAWRQLCLASGIASAIRVCDFSAFTLNTNSADRHGGLTPNRSPRVFGERHSVSYPCLRFFRVLDEIQTVRTDTEG